MTINLTQIRSDFDNGIIVSKQSLLAAIDYAIELENQVKSLDPKSLAEAALKPHMARIISSYDPCDEQADAAVTVSAERLEVLLKKG